jgi:circadian clock protein KaiC
VHEIRLAVTEHGAKVIVIDSLNGYLNAMPDERFLIVQLHELLTYLGQSGVATLLVGAQHGLIGMQMQTPVDASYLADAVVLLRYFEVRRRGAPGHLGAEEARRRARALDPRLLDGPRRA